MEALAGVLKPCGCAGMKAPAGVLKPVGCASMEALAGKKKNVKKMTPRKRKKNAIRFAGTTQERGRGGKKCVCSVQCADALQKPPENGGEEKRKEIVCKML